MVCLLSTVYCCICGYISRVDIDIIPYLNPTCDICYQKVFTLKNAWDHHHHHEWDFKYRDYGRKLADITERM